MRKFPGTFTSSKGKKVHLTDEQLEWFIRWFPVTENKRLMKASGIKESTLHRLARTYGLKKSEVGLRRILVRSAQKNKRKMEENGYYASKRGKQPSEATMRGVQRMWEEIREGKRLSPLQSLKKHHPRKYQLWRKHKGESRKELIRKERMRAKWGLERKTRLITVVMQPYRKSQTAHRFSAKKRGYILGDSCLEGSGHRYVIYYDDMTNRSEKFEQNCIKDGFRFVEL